MTYPGFVSDLPPHRIVCASPEENEEVMRQHGINQEVRQLGRGAFRADLAIRSIDQVELLSDRFSTACSMLLEPPEGTVALLFFRSANGPLLANGVDVANDKLVVFPRGSEADLVTPDLAGSEAIGVPERRFVEMAEVLCPPLRSVRPDGSAVIEGDSMTLEALRNAVSDLVAQPDSSPDPERVCHLIAGIIAWIGDSGSHGKPEVLIVNGARGGVARLAREFIEENYRQPVRLEDLCRVTGVGVRTLQRCFREYFDLTITDYLKTVRLDKARRVLLASQPRHGHVGKIALDHGCAHFGRFSVEYRERFGESPSESLARHPGRDP